MFCVEQILGQLVRWYVLLHFIYLLNVTNYGYKMHRKEELIGLRNFLKTFFFSIIDLGFFSFAMSGQFNSENG